MKKLILILSFMSVFSCCSGGIEQYSNNSPKFDLLKYFKGDLEAFGMMQDRSGKVTRRFTVKMNGVVDGNKLTLHEYFVFDDGEKQERTWKVEFKDENNFTASAGDVIGVAKGKQYGNALQMKYVLRVPYKKSEIDLTVDDWMYLIDEKRLVNVSKIKKFGFTVAKLTIGFNKK